LQRIFASANLDSQGDLVNDAGDSWFPKLECLYEKCNARDLGFTRSEFCEILMDVLSRSRSGAGSPDERARFLESLRLDDLILARACARGHEKAWDQFLNLYREKLYSAAISIAKEESIARELADSLYADLFGTRTGNDGCRISKLESYLGRGSLEGWLRTVLAQEYVNRFRNERKLVPFDDSINRQAKATFTNLTEAQQDLVARATDAALAALSSSERFLLATYYLDGRTLSDIARVLGVHESTVSRRLEKTTRTVRKRILGNLCRAGVPKGEAKELMELDVRDLNMDVRNRLAQEI
jgi:RNA polymerase sigma-70 factor, ECF subfamily